METHLFSFSRAETQNLCGIFIKNDGIDTCKHLLEVFLQAWDVLAVTNDFQQIFISNEIEPTQM